MVNFDIRIIRLLEQISGLSSKQILECSADIKVTDFDTENDLQRYNEFRKLLLKLDINKKKI